MDSNPGQELASASGIQANVAAPASGATVTLWLSTDDRKPQQTARLKRLIVNVYSSHVSATDGLQIDECHIANADGTPVSTSWRNVVSYTVAATTDTKNYISVSAPFLRVRYVNSANALTTWEYSVLTDENERATQ